MKRISIAAFLTVCIFAFFSFLETPKTIVIDAGHGGSDSGATVQEIAEKNITMAVAQQIKALNTNRDVHVVLVREDDSFPSLEQRVKFINSQHPDLVISLHVDSNNKRTDRSGTRIFHQSSEASVEAAKKLAEKLSSNSVSEQKFKVLRESVAPALLVELGFLSNENDRKYLSSTSGQKEIARKILEFIDEY